MYLVCSCFKNILIKLIWIDLWVLFQTNKYSQEDLIKILTDEADICINKKIKFCHSCYCKWDNKILYVLIYKRIILVLLLLDWWREITYVSYSDSWSWLNLIVWTTSSAGFNDASCYYYHSNDEVFLEGTMCSTCLTIIFIVIRVHQWRNVFP